MLRTTPLVLILGACSACGGAPGAEGRGEDRGEISSQVTALDDTLPPAFVADGMTECADVRGEGGSWRAQRGRWSVCHALRITKVDGCGYDWSSSAGEASAADVDALAAGIGPSVNRLLPAGDRASASTLRVCAHMNHPNPGSTPCGACQVGMATSTHVYLSLGTPFDEDTTLGLEPEAELRSRVVVVVPAHETTFSRAMALPEGFASGVALYLPSE